jgi:hypothetical protein
MKALSLTQPWAWIILHLQKRVENRTRNLGNYRGPLLLHAAKGMTEKDWWAAYDFVAARLALGLADEIPPFRSARLVRGAVIGICDVVNQCEPGAVWHDDLLRHEPADWKGDQERWYMGQHAYILANVRALPKPIPCKGALGFWTPTPTTLENVRSQL